MAWLLWLAAGALPLCARIRKQNKWVKFETLRPQFDLLGFASYCRLIFGVFYFLFSHGNFTQPMNWQDRYKT